jgi:hypothetical protein
VGGSNAREIKTGSKAPAKSKHRAMTLETRILREGESCKVPGGHNTSLKPGGKPLGFLLRGADSRGGLTPWTAKPFRNSPGVAKASVGLTQDGIKRVATPSEENAQGRKATGASLLDKAKKRGKLKGAKASGERVPVGQTLGLVAQVV